MIEIGKVLGTKELKSRLPWRYPFLLLDRAIREEENKFVAYKNLTMNELFFQGHFPGHPIMPGVLQVEAMKQLGELIVRKELDQAGLQDVYMRKVEKVKFRNPVEPGDRLRIEAEITDINESEAVIQACTFNNTGMTCEARLTLAVRPRTGPETMPPAFNAYDRSPETAMNVNRIMEIVPHRYPFLLIDNIARLDGDNAVAIKNVTITEEIFKGFPSEYAAFPESLQCEIIAQVGCACVLSRAENAGKLGLFAAIPEAESFAPVFPGDQMVCEVVLPPSKKAFGKGSGVIKVNDKVVFKITLMFAIVDR